MLRSKMYRSGGRLFMVLALTLAGVDCFQWTADLPDNIVEYACANDDLRLPWDYTTSPGDAITSVQWFFRGRSQELIAMYSNGNFLQMAAFSERVQYVPNAGLILSHVVGGDSGNYSVEISGHDASGSFFMYRRTVVVQITDRDKLMTTDGLLHATLEPQAIYSNATGEWSLVVSCGKFTYLGDPPFVMEWLSESGVVSPSGRYEDGEFQLEVLTGGDYTCRIPQQAAADVCLVNSSRQASVHIDPMEARMTLMEARQAQLQAKNNRLEEKEVNLTQYIHHLEQRLDAKDSSLTQSVQSISNKVSQRIGFTAVPSSTHTSGTIVYGDVKSSYGTGYSSSTGIFTAPIAGLYFFTATSEPNGSDYFPDAKIKKEGSILCYTYSFTKGDTASCGAVVYLSVGQRVWVESDSQLHPHSSFSGSLINSD